MKEIYPNIFKEGNKFYTLNSVRGNQVYGESLIEFGDKEFRYWDPFHSKLCSAMIKGIKSPLKPESSLLYLGAASGTTVSHVSDVLNKGFVYGVEFSKRVTRELYLVAKRRSNLSVILEDANHPERYIPFVPAVDFVYQDIAQKNQFEIFLKNTNLFLKRGGYGLLALKARSVDVTQKPKKIFNRVKQELDENFKIIDYRILKPFQADHCFYLVKKE